MVKINGPEILPEEGDLSQSIESNPPVGPDLCKPGNARQADPVYVPFTISSDEGRDQNRLCTGTETIVISPDRINPLGYVAIPSGSTLYVQAL